jgi:hypothetical protein
MFCCSLSGKGWDEQSVCTGQGLSSIVFCLVRDGMSRTGVMFCCSLSGKDGMSRTRGYVLLFTVW